MSTALILICQPGMDLKSLVAAVETTARTQGYALQELPPPAVPGFQETQSFAFFPDDLGPLLTRYHPNVTPFRRPS